MNKLVFIQKHVEEIQCKGKDLWMVIVRLKKGSKAVCHGKTFLEAFKEAIKAKQEGK